MKRWPAAVLFLLLVATPGFSEGVKVKATKEHFDFLVGDALVTRYHIKGFPRPIFYPINAPGGIGVTRSWPMEKQKPGEAIDHIHQKSAWFCHGDVIPEGLTLKPSEKVKHVDGVDFWSENKGHGNIKTVSVSEPKYGKDFAQIVCKNEWQTSEGTKIMDEVRTITVYDLGKARMIVVDVELAADSFPITFGDTKEGSMGIRINHDIHEGKDGKGKIQNAEGKVGEKECWGHVSAWNDYSGPLDGKTVGLAILADAKNPIPTCWHSRGYGLMAANPFGRTKAGFPDMKGKTELVKLAKGEKLRMRYGLLVHEGDAVSGKVAEHYQRFLQARND